MKWNIKRKQVSRFWSRRAYVLVVSFALVLIISGPRLVARVALNLGFVAFTKGITLTRDDSCRGDAAFLAHAERLGEFSLQLIGDPTTYEFLGNVHMWQGEGRKSAEAWRETGYSPAHFIAKGQQHDQQKRYRCALDLYRAMIEMWPESSLAWFYMGETLAAQAKYAEAIELYDRAVVLDNFEGGTVRLGDVYLRKGEALRALQAIADAYEVFLMALEVGEFSTPLQEAVANFRKGEMLVWMGRYSEAVAPLETTIQLTPEYYHAYSLLGLISYRQGDFAQALRFFGYAIQIEPNYVWTYLYLAQMYADAGEVELAEKYYRIVLQISPGNQNAVRELSRLKE